MLQKKAVVLGHICLDITPAFPAGARPEAVFIPGRLTEVGPADIHAGGVVANTGLAMKYFGADVRLVGKIGDDALGSMVLRVLKEFDAEGDMIIDPESATSYSVVLALPGKDRIFLHDPGANHTFSFQDVPTDVLEDAALLHFGYPPLMEAMYRNDGEELLRLLKYAKSRGIATSLDMAAVDPGSAAGQADWQKILRKILPYVDIFVPSAEELCFMTDRPRFCEWARRARGGDMMEVLDFPEDVAPLADRVMEMGPKILLIKCGAAGLYYRTAGPEALKAAGPRLGLDPNAFADRRGFERSFIPKAVLSATGAGDTCIAAFLTAMLSGRSMNDCVALGAAAGACCVSAYDALSGLLPLSEMDEKIKNGWQKTPSKHTSSSRR